MLKMHVLQIFSRNAAKSYRIAILTNFFWCMRSKHQWSTHPLLFFNPLMLVVTKGHTHLNKPASLSWRFAYVCMIFCHNQVLKGVLKFLEEKTHEIRYVLPAVFFEKAVLKIFGKLLQNHQRQNAYWKLTTMLNMSSGWLLVMRQHSNFPCERTGLKIFKACNLCWIWSLPRMFF